MGIDRSPMECELKDLMPIRVELVSRTTQEPLWNQLVEEYHYLGCKGLPGCNLKYLAYSQQRVVAALGWRAAALKLAARDAFIGWSADQRKAHLRQIANGSRFLILPWVQVYSLASHVLSQNIPQLVEDWHRIYGSELLLLESFVDPRKFTGSCYKASNWMRVGRTKGYTKQGAGYRYHGQIKEVYLYVVNRKFRRIVGCQQRPLTQLSAAMSMSTRTGPTCSRKVAPPRALSPHGGRGRNAILQGGLFRLSLPGSSFRLLSCDSGSSSGASSQYRSR